MLRHRLIAYLAAVSAMVGAAAGASPVEDTAIGGRYTAVIRTIGHDGGSSGGDDVQVVILRDRSTGTERRLLRSRREDDLRRTLINLTHPLFSLDGGFLYVSSSDIMPASGAVHRIDLKSGKVRFVAPGEAISVLRTGPLRGYLLVVQHRYWPRGGSYNPVIVIRPDGHEQMVVPGSGVDDGADRPLARWLAKTGYTAW